MDDHKGERPRNGRDLNREKSIVRRATREALSNECDGFKVVTDERELAEVFAAAAPAISAAIRGYPWSREGELTAEEIERLSVFAARCVIQKAKGCDGLPATISLAEYERGASSGFSSFQIGPSLPKDKLLQVVTDLRNLGEPVVGVYDNEGAWIYYKKGDPHLED